MILNQAPRINHKLSDTLELLTQSSANNLIYWQELFPFSTEQAVLVPPLLLSTTYNQAQLLKQHADFEIKSKKNLITMTKILHLN